MSHIFPLCDTADYELHKSIHFCKRIMFSCLLHPTSNRGADTAKGFYIHSWFLVWEDTGDARLLYHNKCKWNGQCAGVFFLNLSALRSSPVQKLHCKHTVVQGIDICMYWMLWLIATIHTHRSIFDRTGLACKQIQVNDDDEQKAS